ncbi:MAG TPA: preprotein translocase subunit YajC [Flavobacteriales bacterium]|nr:preprotein translocase subunit YajC [Flavobacteriales bacterium]HIO68587.1 preprotein translocase subunit YajC [Flavobacteriales bacterium]
MDPGQGESSPMTTILMFGSIILVFYFFMLRPQMKKQKDQRKFKDEVKKGDKVVTLGGIHGKIVEIRDSVFILDIENGGKIKVEKSAISMEYTTQVNKKS